MTAKKTGTFLCAAALMAGALAFSAYAADSVQDQMAANSAAWMIAYNAGDTATCNALHQANVELAEQLASGGGSSSYDAHTGSWTITDASGNTTQSGSSSSGKTTTAVYTTVSENGNVSSSTATSYTDSSINAYMQNGGTQDGLVNSYNNAAEKVAQTNGYGEFKTTDSAENEVAVAQEVLGLTDEEAGQLKTDLEKSQTQYNAAKLKYAEALQNGDEAAAAEAKAEMDRAHDEAQATRAKYNYTADSQVHDGGSYFGDEADKGTADDGFCTVNIVQKCTITANSGRGGTISPSGVQSVPVGGSCTFTVSPDTGYEIAGVTVDGKQIGKVSTYTFSDIRENHNITADFSAVPAAALNSAVLTDISGRDLDTDSIKSGYGIFALVSVSSYADENVQVTATYDFGEGMKTVILEKNDSGQYVFPVNPASRTGQRCVYIPVSAADGTYTVTLSLSTADGATVLQKHITVLGSMYDDDYTGDR